MAGGRLTASPMRLVMMPVLSATIMCGGDRIRFLADAGFMPLARLPIWTRVQQKGNYIFYIYSCQSVNHIGLSYSR
jgi:hypothetical protein